MFVFSFLIALVPAYFLLALLIGACVKQEGRQKSRAAKEAFWEKKRRGKNGR